MREGQAYLNDPAKGVAWIVTLPELLPVTEALELAEGLRATHVEPAGMILNRFPEDPFEPEERAELEALLADRAMHGALSFQQVDVARAAGALLRARADVPIFELPELPDAPADAPPPKLVQQLAAWMDTE
jgi:hypothetical protein